MTMPPSVPAVLMMLKTVALNRPPRSVQVPQTVGWLQSLKNLAASRNQAAATPLDCRTASTSKTQPTTLPTHPTPLRDQRRLPVRAIERSLSHPPDDPAESAAPEREARQPPGPGEVEPARLRK